MGHSAAQRSAVATAHTLGSHSDVSGAPARGDIYVRSAAGLWVPKTLGAANTFLASDGLDPNYRAILETDITDGALLARLAANETVAGTWNFTPGLKERGRTAAIGEWTDVTYAAGNFTVVTGGGTWTVESGDQITYEYALVGKTMLLNIVINTTSISGTVSRVGIAIPGGFTAAKQAWGTCYLYDNSSTTFTIAGALVLAAGTRVEVFNQNQTAWAASANNTYLRASMVFEVQ